MAVALSRPAAAAAAAVALLLLWALLAASHDGGSGGGSHAPATAVAWYRGADALRQQPAAAAPAAVPDHRQLPLGVFDTRGTWHPTPVTDNSTFVPDAGFPPAPALSRAGLLSRWGGRHVVLTGDSISRYTFYASMWWLHGCGPHGGRAYDADPLPAMAPAARAAVCDAIAPSTWKRDASALRWSGWNNHTVTVPASASSSVSFTYIYAGYVADLATDDKALTRFGQPPSGASVLRLLRQRADGHGRAYFVIANAGLWHLRNPREAPTAPPAAAAAAAATASTATGAMDGYLSETAALVRALRAEYAAQVGDAAARRATPPPPPCTRLLWRTMAPVELRDEVWSGVRLRYHEEVDAGNRLVAPEWAAGGYPLLWYERYMRGARPPPPQQQQRSPHDDGSSSAAPAPGSASGSGEFALTMDGLHPVPKLLVTGLLAALEPGPAHYEARRECADAFADVLAAAAAAATAGGSDADEGIR